MKDVKFIRKLVEGSSGDKIEVDFETKEVVLVFREARYVLEGKTTCELWDSYVKLTEEHGFKTTITYEVI